MSFQSGNAKELISSPPKYPPILVQGMSKTFNSSGKQKAKKAVCNLTLSSEQGSVLSILGPNGAGKTTFMRCLIGLFP